jgi:hypothetical protein
VELETFRENTEAFIRLYLGEDGESEKRSVGCHEMLGEMKGYLHDLKKKVC